MTDNKRHFHEYRVRRLSDGLYSTGGIRPKWNREGKTWKDLHHVKKHFAMVRYPRSKDCPYKDTDNFEIVCDYYVLERQGGHCTSLREMFI